MPRTTLQLDDEAMRVARAHAARHRMTLGKAVSTLVRRGAERSVVTVERNGFRVLWLDHRSRGVTAAQVDKLLDELP
jgi:hypothetical protein